MPPELTVGQAVVLGLLHGPAELLPVSSSAHIGLVPVVLGWPYPGLDPELRKAFEVALHAGTLAGLLVLVPRPRLGLAVAATLPAAVAGLAFEGPIEHRVGGVAATAAGLVVGAAILVVADARAGAAARRTVDEATRADGLALGMAQALALAPGLSRTGLTVAAARRRGFARPAAFDLSRRVALPVLAGATALKGSRLARGGLPSHLRAPFAAGAGAALLSTLAAAPLRRVTAIGPIAAERLALAALALARLRRSQP